VSVRTRPRVRQREVERDASPHRQAHEVRGREARASSTRADVLPFVIQREGDARCAVPAQVERTTRYEPGVRVNRPRAQPKPPPWAADRRPDPICLSDEAPSTSTSKAVTSMRSVGTPGSGEHRALSARESARTAQGDQSQRPMRSAEGTRPSGSTTARIERRAGGT
jgi:hypothetical protein